MKKIFILPLSLILTLSLFLIGCGGVNADESVDMSVRRISTESTASLTEMLSQARSAVVGISAEISDGYAIGSGVAISDNGYILTNNHVVEGGKNLTLYYADKLAGSATLMWSDPAIDLAVIKSSREIPYLGTYEGEIEIGQTVYALGTPLTLQFKHTVTGGIVSATDRTLESDTPSGTVFLQSLIQHDAAINPGNSGGPLIDKQGRVIGINTLKATEGEGIGFAIPIKIGRIVVQQLQQNPNYTTPYLGIFGFDSEIALANGQQLDRQGVYVISTDGPALKAGIKKGDLITHIADSKITNLLSLRSAILTIKKGDSVLIKYFRNGIEYEAIAQIG